MINNNKNKIKINILENINSEILNRIVSSYVSVEFQSDLSSVYRTKNKKINSQSLFQYLNPIEEKPFISFSYHFVLHTYHPSSQCFVLYYNWHITTSNAHFFRPWRSINSTRNRAKVTWGNVQRKSRFKWNDINRIPDDLLPDKTSLLPCTLPKTSNSTETKGSLQRGSSAAILPG